MKNAVMTVQSKEMGLRKASNCFQVPRSNWKNEEVEILLNVPLVRKPILSTRWAFGILFTNGKMVLWAYNKRLETRGISTCNNK